MQNTSGRNSRQTLYLLSIIATVLVLLLGLCYLIIDPATDNRFLLLALALIPNVISTLIAFVIVYLFFYIRGIDASLAPPPPNMNTHRLVRELTPKLAEALRQASISDATIQKIVKELRPLITRSERAIGSQADDIMLLRKHVANQFHQAYIMLYNFRSDLYKRFRETTDPQNTTYNIRAEDYDLFQNFCRLITDSARTSLIEYFKAQSINVGEDVAITVKLIMPTARLVQIFPFSAMQKSTMENRAEWVITVFRDSYTYINYRDDREVGAIKLYTVEGNTAFKTVYEGAEMFLHNNLKDLHSKGAYANENTEWQKHYNATLVVPIQSHDRRINRREFYGFLAADSKNSIGKELYDRDVCMPILKHGAELFATFFLILAMAYSPTGSSTNLAS